MKLGKRVRVESKISTYDGKTGTVDGHKKHFQFPWHVQFDGVDKSGWFMSSELKPEENSDESKETV